MRFSGWLGITFVLAMSCQVIAQPVVIFYDSFESGMGNWSPWEDVTDPNNCCGPQPLFNDGSHTTDGVSAARQEQAQPWWYGSVHDEPSLAVDAGQQVIEVSVWQFEDANRLAPEHTSHDQVQGWLALMNEDETEFFAIGVHASWNSPEPLLDWWQHLSWATTTDGWHTTTVPRVQGFRNLKIVLNPYTGQDGDVEFYVDDVLVATGHRQGDQNCDTIPVSRVGIGSSPAHVPEDYISNTYEFFWYDELEIATESVVAQTCPNPELRFDFDADGDVDQDDFGVLQACVTGVGEAYDCYPCRCMDADVDLDVDHADYTAFEDCASGPEIMADTTCDDAYPAP